MFHKILVPLDGSLQAERALPFAVEIAQDYNASLLLLYAAQDLPTRGEALVGYTWMATARRVNQARDHHRAYLEQIADAVACKGIAIHTLTPIGEPAAAIVAAARTHNADLIIMTVRGHAVFSSAVTGTIACNVVTQTACPVLLVH